MKNLSAQALAAKAIRRKLKKAFPSVKFRVTSKSYSGGDSVNIYWDNGPTHNAVMSIARAHEYGSFDGMTDSYSHDNVRDDIPQTKYILAHRHTSGAIRDAAFKICKERYGFFEDVNSIDDYLPSPIDEYVQHFIGRYLGKMDLTNGVTPGMFKEIDVS